MDDSYSIYLKPSGRIYYAVVFAAFLLLSALLFLLEPWLGINAPLGSLWLLVLAFCAWGFVFLYFQYHYIHVEDGTLTVREGLLTRKMVIIPFEKITEIESVRSALEALFGVGTVKIDTSGTSGMEIIFRNVPKESIDSFLGFFRRYQDSGAKPQYASKEEEERDTW